ncbi:hypothetical protein L1887_49910 [Cichorium endivia]|nr:hypothetical protein L1887_49910 [Cichorium endivia]
MDAAGPGGFFLSQSSRDQFRRARLSRTGQFGCIWRDAWLSATDSRQGLAAKHPLDTRTLAVLLWRLTPTFPFGAGARSSRIKPARLGPFRLVTEPLETPSPSWRWDGASIWGSYAVGRGVSYRTG